MFGFRLCKRNRLSSLRLLVVFLCICFVVMLLNTMKPAPEIKDIDFINDMSLDPNTDKQLMNIAPIPRQDEADISKELGKNEVAFAVDTDPPQSHPTQSQLNHQTGKYDVGELRKTVKELNEEQRILNLKRFPKRSNNSIVIVVQVHSRAKYLLKLIQSLRNTRGISDALLIFSHDYFASEINNLVRGIDFCQVLQIYFPYSQQLHPDEFPGTDPDDCRRNIRKEEALALGCKNAEHPDMYGHYREAKFTMTKHHWWWKANRVFQDLRSTTNHQGLVLFIEEDHYVSPDFYKVLQRVYSKKKTSSECQEHGCDIVTLGDYRKIDSFQDVRGDVVQLQPWKSTENNMGMSFDRTTWNKIIRCHNVFCTYDDYNWDWTLMRMSKVCFNKQLTVLLLKAPRIFHLGTCGLHHKSSYCDVETVLDQIKRVISNSEKVLNPKHIVISIVRPWIQGYIGQPNGGWGDKRDHKLCMQFVKSTEK